MIALAVSFVYTLYFKNRIGCLGDTSLKKFEDVIYFGVKKKKEMKMEKFLSRCDLEVMNDCYDEN